MSPPSQIPLECPLRSQDSLQVEFRRPKTSSIYDGVPPDATECIEISTAVPPAKKRRKGEDELIAPPDDRPHRSLTSSFLLLSEHSDILNLLRGCLEGSFGPFGESVRSAILSFICETESDSGAHATKSFFSSLQTAFCSAFYAVSSLAERRRLITSCSR